MLLSLKTSQKQFITVRKPSLCCHRIFWTASGATVSSSKHWPGHASIKLYRLFTGAVRFLWLYKTGLILTGKIALSNRFSGNNLKKRWSDHALDGLVSKQRLALPMFIDPQLFFEGQHRFHVVCFATDSSCSLLHMPQFLPSAPRIWPLSGSKPGSSRRMDLTFASVVLRNGVVYTS